MAVHLPLKVVHRHTTFLNKLNGLRIPTGRKHTSWLYTSSAEELNQWLPGTNPGSGQSGRLGISRFQVRHPGHTATLPPTAATITTTTTTAAAAAAAAAATTTTTTAAAAAAATTKMGQFRTRKNPYQSLTQVIIHLWLN